MQQGLEGWKVMAVDIRKWFEQHTAGLPEEERAAAERIINGTLGQKLSQEFYPQEAVSGLQSALDTQRNTYQAQLDERDEWNRQWQDRYYEDMAAVGAVDRLEAAGFDVSNLRETAGGGVMDDATGSRYSAADVQQLVTQQLAAMEQRLLARIEPVRSGLVDYTTFISEKVPEHMAEYGAPLKVNAFKQYAYDNRDKFPSLDAAYEAFTADARKAKEESEREKWRADERERIRLEVHSEMTIPEAAPGAGGSPFFSDDRASAPASSNPEIDARQAFAKKWAGKDLTS